MNKVEQQIKVRRRDGNRRKEIITVTRSEIAFVLAARERQGLTAQWLHFISSGVQHFEQRESDLEMFQIRVHRQLHTGLERAEKTHSYRMATARVLHGHCTCYMATVRVLHVHCTCYMATVRVT